MRFRLCSYNLLAEIYATQQAYPYCDFWALSWGRWKGYGGGGGCYRQAERQIVYLLVEVLAVVLLYIWYIQIPGNMELKYVFVVLLCC